MASRAVPILPSPDLDATLAFYQGLGFTNLGAPSDEWDYLIIGRDDSELHFIGPSSGARPAGICFLYVDDANVLYAEWQGTVVAPARIEAPVDQDYGMRTFTLIDPHDNEVRVGSTL